MATKEKDRCWPGYEAVPGKAEASGVAEEGGAGVEEACSEEAGVEASGLVLDGFFDLSEDLRQWDFEGWIR